MAENQPKSGKHLKPKTIPSFLGDVGLIKVPKEFLFGHPKCHFFVPEYGHFCQKCPSLCAQKWHFGYPNEISLATFIIPTSPKNDGIVFGFKRLPLFGWFSANFYGQVFPLCISNYEIKLELKNKGRVFRIS